MKFSPYVLLLLLISTSCHDNESPVDIYRVDISDAKTFLAGALKFSESSLKVTKTDGSSKLYKVTADNKIREVKFLDVDGNKVDAPSRFRQVIDVNATYFYLEFGTHWYLVRKQGGFAFRLSEQPWVMGFSPPSQLSTEAPAFQTDKYGNIYYVARGGGIGKLDMSDPYNPVQTVVTGLGDSATKFYVDQDGNLAFHGYDMAGRSIFRWRSANGPVENLPGPGGVVWNDFQNNIYYTSGTLPDAGFSSTTVWLDPTATAFKSVEVEEGCEPVGVGSYGGILTIRGKQQTISVYTEGIRTFSKTEMTFCNHSASIFNLNSIGAAAEGVDHYFLGGVSKQGKNVLIKVDPATNAYETMVDGGYNFLKVAATQNGEVIFSAISTTTNQIVLGHVSQNNEITILRESLPDIVSFETVLDLP